MLPLSRFLSNCLNFHSVGSRSFHCHARGPPTHSSGLEPNEISHTQNPSNPQKCGRLVPAGKLFKCRNKIHFLSLWEKKDNIIEDALELSCPLIYHDLEQTVNPDTVSDIQIF